MNAGLGRETRSFQEVMASDYEQSKSEGINPWSYYGMSLYYDNIQRFKSLFGERVLVLNLSDYKRDKNQFLHQLYTFLEVKTLDLDLPHSNSSSEIKHKKLLKFLHNSGLKDIISRILPKKLRHAVFNKIPKAKNEFNEIEIPEEILISLQKEYETITAWIK